MKKKIAVFSIFYIGIVFLLSLCCLIFFGNESNRQDIDLVLHGPSYEHFFGTDQLGRDLLLRIFYGGFFSIVISFVSSFITISISVILGLLAGWFEGKTQIAISTVVHLFQSIPNFVVIIILGYFINKNLDTSSVFIQVSTVIFLISITHWYNSFLVFSNEVKKIKVLPFVEAAKAIGASNRYIISRHILPQLETKIKIIFLSLFPICLMYESFLSFIGFGIKSPYLSWGLLIQDGWKLLSDYPNLMLFPSGILFSFLLAINFILDKKESNESGF